MYWKSLCFMFLFPFHLHLTTVVTQNSKEKQKWMPLLSGCLGVCQWQGRTCQCPGHASLIERGYPRNILQAVNWHPWNWMWHPKWHLLGRKLDRQPSREIIASVDAPPKTMLGQCTWVLSHLCNIALDPLFWQWAQTDLLSYLGWSCWQSEHQGERFCGDFFFLILQKVIQCHPLSQSSAWANTRVQWKESLNGKALAFTSKARAGFPENRCLCSPVPIRWKVCDMSARFPTSVRKLAVRVLGRILS